MFWTNNHSNRIESLLASLNLRGRDERYAQGSPCIHKAYMRIQVFWYIWRYFICAFTIEQNKFRYIIDRHLRPVAFAVNIKKIFIQLFFLLYVFQYRASCREASSYPRPHGLTLLFSGIYGRCRWWAHCHSIRNTGRSNDESVMSFIIRIHSYTENSLPKHFVTGSRIWFFGIIIFSE